MAENSKKARTKPRYKLISLDIQPKLLEKLDKDALEMGITRAELVRRLLAQPLKGKEELGKWGE